MIPCPRSNAACGSRRARLAALSVAVGLFVFGCASSQSYVADGVDSGASLDASPVRGDAGVVLPGDSAPDTATHANDANANDAATEAAVTGLSWPPGQVFPSFAPIGTLDVVDVTSLDAGQITLATTLEGLVNRKQPRIYLTDQGGAGAFWLSELDASTNTVADPLSLVTKYRSEISGIVIYDEALMDTLNLASTIAGVEGGIVSSPEIAPTLTSPPYSLPVLADLRTNHFATKLDVYRYELNTYAQKATHRLIVGLEPTFDGQLRDYAIATQAMVTWLDPTVTAEASLLGQYLSLLPATSPYMGWTPNEPAGVSLAANHGVPVFAADWSTNLTVLGGAPRGSTPPQAPPPPPLANKVYVAIFMSDGDNLQEDEGLIPLKWSDSARGAVPISWTVDPALVDVAPTILRYFQKTATVNDLLVSGPSGLGYTYPAAWPSAATFDHYAQVSGRYMSAAGLTVATVWNNGADLSAANAQSYVTNVPNLLGLTIQSSTTALELVGNGIPIDEMSVSYASTASDLENGINAVLATYAGTKPIFAAVQGDMNMSTIDPAAFAAVEQYYATNTHVLFVRADHFFELLSRAQTGASHEVWSGDFNGDGKTDSLFYYSGNGDFWLGLSNGNALVWGKAGNVAAQFPDYRSFLSASYAFYSGDFNGDGKTDMMLYSASTGAFWLGASNGATLTWTNANTNPGFGNLLDGKHDIHIGDYDGDGKTDVAFYSSADGNWWIGASNGTTISWSGAGNTTGFGNLLDGSHALYDGDFNGDGKADVLFFYNGDQSLWLGLSSGASLAWSRAGSASGFGNLIDGGHRLVAGDFNGDHLTDLLFYYSGDGNWWLGLSTGTGFDWAQASNIPTATNLVDWNHRIYTLDANGDGNLDIATYDSRSGDWEVGLSNGHTLAWGSGGNTAGFGDLADPSRLLFFGDYDGDGKREPLFYYSGDGNWWMAASSGAAFTWHAAGNTSGFGDLTR